MLAWLYVQVLRIVELAREVSNTLLMSLNIHSVQLGFFRRGVGDVVSRIFELVV